MSARAVIPPRLLTRQQAAGYCGLSVPTFEATCPVRPIALGDERRLERYDMRALDAWIDGLGEGSGLEPATSWLGLVEERHVSRSDQGP